MIDQVGYLANDLFSVPAYSSQWNFDTFLSNLLCGSLYALPHKACCIAVIARMFLPSRDNRLKLANKAETGPASFPQFTCRKILRFLSTPVPAPRRNAVLLVPVEKLHELQAPCSRWFVSLGVGECPVFERQHARDFFEHDLVFGTDHAVKMHGIF